MEKPVKVTPKAKAKGFINGFKNFITRGNVVDMAIGVIIGGAFGKIVSSLINDIILPPIGFLLGGVAFKDLKINIAQQTIGGVPQFDANNNQYLLRSTMVFHSSCFKSNYGILYLSSLVLYYQA